MKRSIRLGLAHPSLHSPEPIPPPEVLLCWSGSRIEELAETASRRCNRAGTGLRLRPLHVLRRVPRPVPGGRPCRPGGAAIRSWTFSQAAKSSRAIRWPLSGASGLDRLETRTRARSFFRERLGDVQRHRRLSALRELSEVQGPLLPGRLSFSNDPEVEVRPW